MTISRDLADLVPTLKESGGNIGIGTTSPLDKLNVQADSTTSPSSGNLAPIVVSGATSSNKRLLIGFNTTDNQGYVQAVEHTVDYRALTLNPQGGAVLVNKTTTTANGGDLQVSKGITFPATQSASTDANTLDDYEEGTWTPASSFSGGNGTRVDTVTGNKYTKIGDIVYAFFDIAVTKGTASGDLSITGLPFARGGSANRGGGVFFTYVSIQALTNGIYGYIGDNSTSFTVYNSYNLANVNTTTNLTGNFQLIGTAIYKV